MTEAIEIRQVSWHSHQGTLRQIRHRVFIEEQQVPVDDEWDGRDESATHFLASAGELPVGCARLQADGKIQRMAVLPEWRRRGVGSALLESAVATAQGHSQTPFLDAQIRAIGFYEKHGFEATGDEFMDAGIPHRRMVPRMQDGSAVQRLAGPDESLRALRASIELGRNTLDILSHQLSPALYTDSEIVNSILALAKRTRHSQVRILVKDTRPLGTGRHALVQLAQRLPSRIGLRGLQEMPQNNAMGYAITDKRALVFFSEEAELAGYRNDAGAAEAKRLLDEFDHLWEHYSYIDPNLQRLSL